MLPTRQPFALDTPGFSFASIVAFAARASLGGPREIALAAYVTARLADDLVDDRALSADGRVARSTAARRWLSTLTLAEPVRRAFLDLAAASETDAAAAAPAVRRVIDVTSGVLDASSRQELDRLARALEAQPIART